MPRTRRRYQIIYLPSVPKPFDDAEHVKFLRDSLVLFLSYKHIGSDEACEISSRDMYQLARNTAEKFVDKFGYDEAVGDEDRAKYFRGLRANIGRWYRTNYSRMVTAGDPLVI